MAENTYTLQQLRRLLASELQMPFARRFSTGYGTVKTNSTTTKIFDTALTQKAGFWDNAWFYHVPSQSVSTIRAYNPIGTAGNFELEEALASISIGDQYEIHNIFNANDIKAAINRAINMASRVFMDTVTDTSIVNTQNTLTYSLASLTKKPWIVSKVWIENKPMMRGAVVSSTNNTITLDVSMQSTMVIPTNYIITIYAGTGAGQQQMVQSVNGAILTLTGTWTTNPDSTSLYAAWDTTYELQDWRLLSEYHLDAKEWPDKLYLGKRIPAWYGARIRLEYMATPSALSLETDTTIIPSEYIIPKVLGILYGQRAKDTKVDQKTFTMEAQRYDKMAEDYMARNMPRKPDITLKQPIQTETYIENDPLNWMQQNGGGGGW